MSIQRLLRLIGVFLFSVTMAGVFIVPTGSLPTAVLFALAGGCVLVFLASMVLTLKNDYSFGATAKALVYISLILTLLGGMGMNTLTNEIIFEDIEQGTVETLNGRGMEGYTLAVESVNNASTQGATVGVVLTRPDQISIHETIDSNQPMVYDGIEIHPLSMSQSGVILYVRYAPFRHLLKIGGVLFLISLGLMTLPQARKRGEDAC